MTVIKEVTPIKTIKHRSSINDKDRKVLRRCNRYNWCNNRRFFPNFVYFVKFIHILFDCLHLQSMITLYNKNDKYNH